MARQNTNTFKTSILALGVLFLSFLILIKSVSGIAQLLFMALIYLFRNPLKQTIRKITPNNFVLIVIFGSLLGLIEETLWYVSEPGIKQTMFKSLYTDLVSTLPVYLIFYFIIYTLAKRQKTTGEKAFLCGGIFGYVFYFIFESGILGIQFGGVPDAPIWLVLIWEINNFFLNGLLVWFPLYLSDLLADKE
jgi:hypothetical protein